MLSTLFRRCYQTMAHFQPLVISGPSGSGKSTLLNQLFHEYGDILAFSVSHTTRSPRDGECDGQHYHFITKSKFETMLNNGEFLEHAQFSGNYYGTSKKAITDIQKSKRIGVLDVEINGVKNLKKSQLDAKYIFVNAPSLDVLKRRLVGRATETTDRIEKRLASAHEAMEYAELPNTYDHIIINDDKDEAYRMFKALLVDDLERVRKDRSKVTDK